ncbi:MAG: hypothetical protein ACK5JM_08615 [Rhodoblastus sp.]
MINDLIDRSVCRNGDLEGRMPNRSIFQITIDTEGDNLWAAPAQVTTENSRYLPRFQRLCEKYGFKPTYVVNWEMANCPNFRAFGRDLLARRTGEIGMHLHAWNSPPIVPLGDNDDIRQPYLIEYPQDVVVEKIHVMTRRLEDVFETKMLTHRAGRWALDGRYARELAALGYTSDCSVTPNVSWPMTGPTQGAHAVDYSGLPATTFSFEFGDGLKLLEIPVTILPKSISFFESQLRRALGKPKPVVWLRPNGRNLSDMLLALQAGLAVNGDYVQFMLHSSELMPGGSPTFDTEEKIEFLYAHLDRLFAKASEKFVGATLSEFVAMRRSVADPRIPGVDTQPQQCGF